MRFAPGPDAKEKRNARQRRYRAKLRKQAEMAPNAYSFSMPERPISRRAMNPPSDQPVTPMRTQGAFPWECPFCGHKVPAKGGYDVALARAERHVGGHH